MAISYRARWVFPVSGPPIPGGVVTVADGRIVAVGNKTDEHCFDQGDVALLPAPINAHTHLELSDLRKQLGHAGMALPNWIRLVIHHRRTRTIGVRDAMSIGLNESMVRGVAAVGDIVSPGADLTVYDQPGSPHAVAFLELIGLGEERIETNLALARDHLAGARHFTPGLSPHAPYTVHPRLLDAVVELARESHAPLAMHLAESREEIELLRNATGPFLAMLEELGAWNPHAIPTGSRPLDYLRRLARAPRALVIHGNYLDDEEIDYLAERSDRMSVVVCPRTHVYFLHQRHPLPKLLNRGVHVALGTDSRASSPYLDILAEVRLVAETFTEVSPAEALRLGTIEGARALGLDDRFGTIETGKRANLVYLTIGTTCPDDPHELLLTDAECYPLP